MSLTPESTLREIFEFFDRGDEPAQAVPVVLRESPDDSQYAIFIDGTYDYASFIFAALARTLQDLSDASEQAEASEDESRIITG